MIERFTENQFKDALFSLHPDYQELGLDSQEYCYAIEINSHCRLKIRSSIDSSGVAADTGQDSIRLWLEVWHPNNTGWQAASKKVDAYTTRVKGWEKRLEKKIGLLWDRAIKVQQSVEICDCGQVPKAVFIKKGQNAGRPFSVCECGKWKALDKPAKIRKVTFNDFEDDTEVDLVFDKEEKEESQQKLPEVQKLSEEERTKILKSLPDNFQLLNDAQLLASIAPVDSNIRVLAGPGSGKTRLIVHRYQHLVDNDINPDDILAVTFSKPMADEMLERISHFSPTVNINQISTIHAFCYRVLCIFDENSLYFRWKVAGGRNSPIKSWQISAKLKDLIGEIWKGEEKPGWKEVISWIDFAKYSGPNAGNLNWYSKYLGALYGEWLFLIHQGFDKWLYSHKCLTFADMLFLMEKRLQEEKGFAEYCQKRWPYLIIDEGHDTNAQAMRILLSFAKFSTVVADPDQMMYRFQGAKPEIITSEYTDGIETHFLDINYRSNDEIVEACKNLITHNYSDLGGPYPQEFMKDLKGVKGPGGSVAFQMYGDIEMEAQAVVDGISELLQNDEYEYKDFFVGARTRAQLGYMEGPLARAGIKFINLNGGSFWQAKHIKDVVDYLRLAYIIGETHIHGTSGGGCNEDGFYEEGHPTVTQIGTKDHSQALRQVYNIPSADHRYAWSDKKGRFKEGDYCPTRYLGQEFLAKIGNDFNNIDNVLFSSDGWRYQTRKGEYSIWGPTKAQDLQEFVWKLESILRDSENAGQVIRYIIDNCYEKYLKVSEGIVASDESENGKLEDLRTVEDLASKYKDPGKFLAFVDDMIDTAKSAKDGDWSEHVILSTYHKQKGLERKVIFGTGWCEGYDPNGESRGLLPHTFSLTDPPQFGILPSGGMNPIEDERCIGFVAISRAKEKVFLSGCSSYRNWTLQPSRFIREAGLDE